MKKVYVILEKEYFEESLCGNNVVGYFEKYEDAKEYLIEDGYEKVEEEDNFLMELKDDLYVKESEFDLVNFHAVIKELSLIKLDTE